MSLNKRKLGSQGLEVSEIGLGCMPMSQSYGPADQDEAIRALHRSIDLGCTFFDTAEVYGPHTNEDLLGRAFKGRRSAVTIATKFGFKIVDGKQVPGEVTSHPDNIRKAHAVFPVTALQSEYSLWERNLEPEIIPVLRELGIGLVPFSPLGRGFLTGKVMRAEEYPENDHRHNDPRYQGENFDENVKAAEVVHAIARDKQATPAQIALAWLLHKGDDVVPIPGTKRQSYLEENVGAAAIALSAADMKSLDAALAPEKVSGDRYASWIMPTVDR